MWLKTLPTGSVDGKKARSSSGFDRGSAGEVPLDDARNVVEGYVGVPDVVWEDEYDGSFLMATGTSVPEHG